MKTIHKFGPFPPTVLRTVDVPVGARFLHVGAQRGEVFVWAEVNTTSPKKPSSFLCVGTGWDLADTPGPMAYLGTAAVDPFVWHLYSVRP